MWLQLFVTCKQSVYVVSIVDLHTIRILYSNLYIYGDRSIKYGFLKQNKLNWNKWSDFVLQDLRTKGHVQRLLKQAEFLAHCEKLSSHRILSSALFPGWLHKILHDRRTIETLFVIQPSEISSYRQDLSFALLESIIGIAIHNEQKSAGYNTGYSQNYHRYC
jgi:hypothetical protein